MFLPTLSARTISTVAKGNCVMAKRIRRRSGLSAPLPRDAFVAVERNPQIVTAVCLVALSLISIGVLLYVARAYILPIVTAFVFAVILAPVCGRLEWMKIPTAIAALLAPTMAAISQMS